MQHGKDLWRQERGWPHLEELSIHLCLLYVVVVCRFSDYVPDVAKQPSWGRPCKNMNFTS